VKARDRFKGVIAALALFLASDEARHVNGVIIPADAEFAAQKRKLLGA
jgi:hypothetical protein